MKRPWLLPLVPLYAAGLAVSKFRVLRGTGSVRRLQWPVISIGNLSTGGSGKTPLTIALALLLKARGFHVDVLSRGYGRKDHRPACVEPDGTSELFGDEPLLIARKAQVPVYVADERYDAGMLAESDENGDQPRVHILDDGFQHWQLARDVDILLLGAADLHDHLLPAGKLREPLEAAMRASVIAIPAAELEVEAKLRAMNWKGPIWYLRRRMEVPSIDGPVIAFCGIAKPGQFFAGLRDSRLNLARSIAFADHHRYTAPDIERLAAIARTAGARALITSEKDQVRLEGFVKLFPSELVLRTVRLRVEIEEESAALTWLMAKLPASSARSCL